MDGRGKADDGRLALGLTVMAVCTLYAVGQKLAGD
jgi:hypothetical protein